MTVAETGQIMDVLRVAYPGFYAKQGADFLRQAIALWAGLFVEEPFEVVSAAVKAHIKTCDSSYPPSAGAIARMIQQLTQPREMTGLEAWSLVTKALRNSAYNSAEEFDRLPPSIRRVVRTPDQLRQWALMDADEVETVIASNFQRSFSQEQCRNREFAALPVDIRAQLPGMADRLRLE